MGKKIFKKVIFGLIMISLIASSCGHRLRIEKKNLIPTDELISLLTDIYISDGLLNIPAVRSRFSSLDSIVAYSHVIEKHGFTKERFDKTMQYYFINDSKELNKIYDQVLGRLSEMQAHVQKDFRAEQAHNSNLWQGKDFYAAPSTSLRDSTVFSFPKAKPGIYTLSYTSTLYPDDQSSHPGPSIYLVASDSLETGKRMYIKTINYLKDGYPHAYYLIIKVPDRKTVRGCLFDLHTDAEIKNHFKFENFSLTYSPIIAS